MNCNTWRWSKVMPSGLCGIGVLSVFLAGCGSKPESTPVPTLPERPVVPASKPLGVGEPFPPLTTQGWINGIPPQATDPGIRLLVVDVWAAWCPYCRETAPALVRLQKNYASRGVAFVSVTNMERDAAEAFTHQFHIPWPSGYGLNPEAITNLGAGSGMMTGGYEIAPTLYLVGRDSKIRWSDQQGRFRHQDAKKWESEVDLAIASALDRP